MSKFLIYIGEGQKFNVRDAIATISSIPGVLNSREGAFIGAIFECEYQVQGTKTIIRISSDAETVTAEGLGDESVKFMLEFQKRFPVDLHAIDMEYSFDLPLRGFEAVDDFKRAACMR
jgi:hypothetical protein